MNGSRARVIVALGALAWSSASIAFTRKVQDPAPSPPRSIHTLADLLDAAANSLAHGDADAAFSSFEVALRIASGPCEELLTRTARLDAYVRILRPEGGDADATRIEDLLATECSESSDAERRALFVLASWQHGMAMAPGIGASRVQYDEEAATTLARSLALAKSDPERAEVLELSSLVHASLARLDLAMADVLAAARIFDAEHDSEGATRCLRRRAYVAYRQGDTTTALALLAEHRAALAAARGDEPDTTESRSNAYITILAQLESGDLDSAAASIDDFVKRSAQILARMTMWTDVLRTHEASAPQVSALLWALLRHGRAHPENAARVSSLATALAESTKSRLLRIALGNPLRMDHVERSRERAIPKKIVLVRYVETLDETTRERRYAVVATHGDIERFVDLGPATEIDEKVRHFIEVDLSLAEPIASAERFANDAHDLFEGLLGATTDWLSSESPTRLVVIAEGSIARVPFDALVVSRGETSDFASLDYLVRHVAVVHLPGLCVLDALPTPDACDRIVGVMASDTADGASALRFLDREESAIRATHERCSILSGSRATRNNLEDLLAGPKIGWLHLACHAEPDPTARNAARLRLVSESATSRGDSCLRAIEILALPLPRGTRIVLSGCGTASGDFVRGEGVAGIWRAFLAAGASSVVSTLRPVDDRSAADWMTVFHRTAARGVPLAEAAREADLAAITGAGRTTLPRGSRIHDGAHPALWAAYICIGDDGGTLPARLSH